MRFEDSTILVTGGCGFIGSALVRFLIGKTAARVVCVDKLTYAGTRESLNSVSSSDRFQFFRTDICDARQIRKLFAQYRPRYVMNLAAESHVDRSIDGPAEFIKTNVNGTFCLLEEALKYWRTLPAQDQSNFRFLHVSTDEVFGTLGSSGSFDECSPYTPRSPYAASKAASDHLVQAWGHTYCLPVIITNCSNNFGPFQYPEKLIPTTILNGLLRRKIPVYGDGLNVRDWLYVDDHVRALSLVLEAGRIGGSYNIGGRNERSNIQVVERICTILDRLAPSPSSSHDLVTFVKDRPGHDFRYAINCSRIEKELGWHAEESFESGLEKTVRWFLSNRAWWEPILGLHSSRSN